MQQARVLPTQAAFRVSIVYSIVIAVSSNTKLDQPTPDQVSDGRCMAPHNNIHAVNNSAGSSWVTKDDSSDAHGMPVEGALKPLEVTWPNEDPRLANPPPGLTHHARHFRCRVCKEWA